METQTESNKLKSIALRLVKELNNYHSFISIVFSIYFFLIAFSYSVTPKIIPHGLAFFFGLATMFFGILGLEQKRSDFNLRRYSFHCLMLWVWIGVSTTQILYSFLSLIAFTIATVMGFSYIKLGLRKCQSLQTIQDSIH
jgi:hypothetical protein